MFDTLQDRLAATFKGLRSRARLSDADIDATAREIRVALLEADVNLGVVKEFVAAIKERASGAELWRSQSGPAGHQDRQRGTDRDPWWRDEVAAVCQAPADGDHARWAARLRQDDAGRQTRAVVAAARLFTTSGGR